MTKKLKVLTPELEEEIVKKRKEVPVGFVSLPIENLVMCQWNYKKFNDEKLQKKLVANIKKNGQIENILVRDLGDGTFEVTNGNHRYLAMQELGFKKVSCYNLGKITEAQAKRIAVETNETKFATDKDKLAELLNDIIMDFDDFTETNPFDDKETDALLALLDDEDELQDDEKTEKPKKSQTVMSAGGEKYTTLKMEVSPKLAERFNNALARFNFLEGSSEKPLDVMIQFIEKHSNEDILNLTGNMPKKKKKAELKR